MNRRTRVVACMDSYYRLTRKQYIAQLRRAAAGKTFDADAGRELDWIVDLDVTDLTPEQADDALEIELAQQVAS